MDDSWDENGGSTEVNLAVATGGYGNENYEDANQGSGGGDWEFGGNSGGGGGYKADVAGFLDDDQLGGGGAPPPEKPKETYIPEEINEEDLFKFQINSGINFDKYASIPVSVTGDNVPPAINTFQEAGLDQRILDNIKRSNYTTPTPIQKNAIPVLLKGRDLMGCAQTGSGKTAAFLLPMIDSMIKEPMDNEPGFPRAIIITPTRELTIQIYEEARKFTINTGIKVQRIYGGAASFHQAESLYNKCDILVATPGRLMDFVNRGYIEFSCVKYLVLDEADRMLDMGFITSIRDVVNNPTMTGKDQLQTLMFSATFPAEIQKLACEFLKNYIFLTIGILGGACTDVQQNFYELTRKEKRKKLTELLNEGDPQGTLVFVERKADADFLAVFMSNTTHSTTSIHGDRLQSQRELALREFKQGVRKVLIATSVAARGLDIPNVNHVINYDMPKSIDEYVHRIGRTGRVGNQGRASSFYDPMSDSAIAGDLVRILTQAGQPVPEFLGGGGGGYGDGNGFGGYDVRNTNGGGAAAGGSTDSYQQPAAAPVEDNWD